MQNTVWVPTFPISGFVELRVKGQLNGYNENNSSTQLVIIKVPLIRKDGLQPFAGLQRMGWNDSSFGMARVLRATSS